MELASRTLIHAGVNFVLLPVPPIDMNLRLNMERFMEESGLAVNKSEKSDNSLTLIHGADDGLQVKIALLQPPQIGQLLIIRPRPQQEVDGFLREVEKVVNAFDFAAQSSPRQIVRRDATIRCLYETSKEHAFKEIWEDFLDQQGGDLAGLQRKIIGGGLRLVLAPKPDDPDPAVGELKIESFLMDPSKIFVESQFSWETPSEPGRQLEPGKMLTELNAYHNQVIEEFFGGKDAQDSSA